MTEPDFTVTVALSALQLSYTYAVIFQELYCSMALFTPRIPSCHHHTCSKIDEANTKPRDSSLQDGRRQKVPAELIAALSSRGAA